ncbi:MAG TPA: DUF4197 family protein [Novosphingobium sp.]|nr:DUF4197 family protein [Novosphingobium sp.]
MPATGFRQPLPQPLMPRRAFLEGTAALGAVAVAAAFSGTALAQATAAPVFIPPGSDGVRQLLVHAIRAAVSQLGMPDGFWNSRVARCGIPVLFAKTRANAAGPLGQDEFRRQLQHRINTLAEAAIRGAAPTLEAGASKLTLADPVAVIRGVPTAATTQLRAEMKSDLVNAMIATLEPILTTTPDPVMTQAVAAVGALGPISNRDVAHAISLVAENGAWYQIGAAEVAIRKNPAAIGDPVLTAAFGTI